MPVDLIAPDGGTLEQWGKTPRRILDTQTITDVFTVRNDSPYWLTAWTVDPADGLTVETPGNVPPYSDTAKITMHYLGADLYSKLITEVRTRIHCESHVAKPQPATDKTDINTRAKSQT